VLEAPNASLTKVALLGGNHGCHHTNPLSADSATPLNFGSSTRGRLMNHAAGKLVVYETLYALNRDFEQVLVHLERLQELGMFARHLGNVFPLTVQETRAWANFEVVQALQPREQEDLTHFGRLHSDVLNEVERWHKKERKPAGKKRRQKRGGAESEGV
jgi:hypothetical protein